MRSHGANFIKNSIEQYKLITPTFHKIIKIMKDADCGYDGSIDHVAFRSFKSNGGIGNISRLLVKDGEYQERDKFVFPEKYLTARWYSPLDKTLPTVFLSEINEEKLNKSSQKIIKSYLSKIYEVNNVLIKMLLDFRSQEGLFPYFWVLHYLGSILNFILLVSYLSFFYKSY